MNFLRNTIASFLNPWILRKNDAFDASSPASSSSSSSSASYFSLNFIVRSFQLILELSPLLHFDCVAINGSPLMSSSPVLLHDIILRHFKITASLFRKPGLFLEIHDLTIVFHPRPFGDSFWYTQEENNIEAKKRNAIFVLDPQGAAVHVAAENLTRGRSNGSFLGTLFVSLLRQILRVDVQNVSIELHSNEVDSYPHHCCVVFESLSIEDGSSLAGAISKRIVTILKQTERPFGRICSIKDLGVKLTISERVSIDVAQRKRSKDAINNLGEFRGFILLWKAVSIVSELQNGSLNGLDVFFPDTMIQMNVTQLQAFLAIAGKFQGLPRVPSPVQSFNGSQQRKRNGRHLWQKAVEKITGGCWRRLKDVVQTGMLRNRYTHLYVAWIAETRAGHSGKFNGLSHTRNLRRKKQHLKILQENLLHMERELPVEAIVLARYVARRKVEDIVKDRFTLVPRKLEKLLFGLVAFWRALKKAFGSLARYLTKAFMLLYFYIKSILIYVGFIWLTQNFILWVSRLECRFLGMLKYFGKLDNSQKTEDFSQKIWFRLRNRKGISLFTSTFQTGSVTLLGSVEYPAFKNADEKFIEETEKGICFTWGNFSAAYVSSPNKMALQLVCEYIKGELLAFPFVPSNRQGTNGFSNGQVSDDVEFLLSSPAPQISLPENLKHNFKYVDSLLEVFAVEDEPKREYPSMPAELKIDSDMHSFLLVSFEASRSTFIAPDCESDLLNCRLTMGCLECKLGYRSATQLGFILRQYAGELILNGQSTEDGLHESAVSSSRGTREVLYARTKQFMSAITIRRSIWLSAAISGPKIHLFLPFLDSEGTYADSDDGAKFRRSALVLCSGFFVVNMWPPKVENDVHNGQNKSGIRKIWLRKPPNPQLTIEKFTTSQSECLQIGSNGILSLQGATLALQDCSDSAITQIVGPIQMSGEFSLCRDQIFSAAGMNDIMSASAIIVFSSIPIAMHLDEIKILLQDSIAIFRFFEQFSYWKYQHESLQNKLPVGIVDVSHQASTSMHAIPLYFGLCLKVEVERLEFIFGGKSTNADAVRSQKEIVDSSLVFKKNIKEMKNVAIVDSKKLEITKIDEKCVCILLKELWTEFSWGDGCQLSLSSGLALTNLSIIKLVNEKFKNEGSEDSIKAPLLEINGSVALVLSQFCVEQLSATIILPWYPLESSPNTDFQLQSAGSEMVAKFEVRNLYLTDGMPIDVINRSLSRASVTKNILISIVLSSDYENFIMSSKGGLVVLNTEALSIMVKEIQLIYSFLSILRNYNTQNVLPSNLNQRVFEEQTCFEGSSWTPEKIQNQQQIIQQDLNSMPVKSYIHEKTFFNNFPWLTGGFSVEISKMCLLLAQTKFTSTGKDLRGVFFEVDAMSKLQGDLNGRAINFDTTQFSICSLEVSAERSLNTGQVNYVPKFGLNDKSVSMQLSKELGESSSFSRDHDEGSFQNIPPELETTDEKPVDSEKKDNYILDNLRISSRIERKTSGWSVSNDGWKGYCSFVGIDIGITTAELELIFAIVMPLSSLSVRPRKDPPKTLNSMQPTPQHFSSYRYEIPDGCIVAVKDVHEHLYLAVEKTDNTYRLTGVLHYSLVGEQALFKVKYSKQKINSSPSWFSLLSLGAKNADGECFRVHYHPGSGLADISSIHDGSWELWQTLPHKNSARTDDVDIDQYDIRYENWVYLINQKSKQGLTLANRSPMMIKKPGSLFKFKILRSDTKASEEGRVPSFKGNFEELETLNPSVLVSVPKIEINVGRASIMLLHETGHGKHIHPLLRGRLENVKFAIHILPLKIRMMGECKMIFEYFEAHVNRWSMVIQPIDTETFYHMRMNMDDKDQKPKSSAFLFVRFDRVDAVISDYSLDMILFIIGELNIAGPYTLKHSPISASRCLVENQTGLELCCTFYDKNMKGSIRIPAGKTDTFLIRNMTSRRDLFPTQVLSSVSLHLEDAEGGLSSPIDLSLTDPRTTAVRTRVESKTGRRRSPGPILVVDVSNESQNGILMTVSPMVRIYNASGLVLELRCRRSNNDNEGVIVILKKGDAIDDSMGAFNAMNMEGEKRKTLSSFNLGNYLLSIRPASSCVPGFCHTSADEDIKQAMFEWSEDIKGLKPFRISGFLEKLKYGLTKTIKGRTSRHSFGTVLCSTRTDESLDGNAKSSRGVHLFVQITRRLIPLTSMQDNEKYQAAGSGATLQEQLELVILPTIRVYNLLKSNITVTLSAASEATAPENGVYIEHGGNVSVYADLTEPLFAVEIQDLMLKSSHLNIGDWRSSVKSVDPIHSDSFKEVEMDINFQDNCHYAKLKIFHGDDGVLQMLVYTQYALRNASNNALIYCTTRNSRSLWASISPWSRKRSIQWPEGEDGSVIDPGMTVSLLKRSCCWLLRIVGRLSEVAILDPESFSGSTELSIDVPHENGIIEQVLLGVTLDLSSAREMYPTRTIHITSRYIVLNDSQNPIFICQDGFQEDENTATLLQAGDRFALNKRFSQGQKPTNSAAYSAYVGSDMIDPSIFSVRVSLQENRLDWSGPVCVNALGSFSLRICKSTESLKVLKARSAVQQSDRFQFVSVDIEDERPSLIIRFRMQSEFTVPYRIENLLPGTSIFFFQKGVGDCVTLVGPGEVAGYAWDDLTQPHKLVICISNVQVFKDINIDKLSSWKSFQPVRQKGGFGLPTSLQSQLETMEQYNLDESNLAKRIDLVNIGYEIYADGRQRVLRVCEDVKSSKLTQTQTHISSPSSKMNFVIHDLGITLLEAKKQVNEVIDAGSPDNLEKLSPFISMRMRRILVELSNTHKHMLFQLKVQNLSVDEKWKGAPFAAMVRVHNADRFDIGETVLHMAVIISNEVSSPMYVKYSSILLQAIDLNLDEDTLMKLVPFYRYSLAESSSSRQIYFEHFEINPIKIVGSFLPGQPLADYTSAQETLRALLHSFIKVPTIKGFTVQLNGVLLCHALLTFRQLAIKCVQHYSWYALRAVYIAKGSKLLPPAFTSLFDDSAASSLDVFFDPSNGSVDLQGLTLGMFNILSEGLNRRGFSGTSRYIGDLERMMKTAGSNILFAILTEVSDNVLKGAETGGIDGMVNGFRRGILNISMEPSFLRSAAIKGGLNRRIKLDRNAGVDEPYIEGYLQAMLDTMFKQDYLRVKVVDDEVLLKNLPPNTMLIEEIMGCVKGFLGREGFLMGGTSTRPTQSLRRLQEENELKKFVPAAVALGEQLFVIFAVRALRNEARTWFKWGVAKDNNVSVENEHQDSNELTETENGAGNVIAEGQKTRRSATNVMLSFVLSSAMAYIDGRLCRHIPNTLARRVVSGFLLSFVE